MSRPTPKLLPASRKICGARSAVQLTPARAAHEKCVAPVTINAIGREDQAQLSESSVPWRRVGGAWRRYQEHIDRIIALENESVALVEMSRGASLQHVQSKGTMVLMLGHDLTKNLAAEASALVSRLQVEVFNPERVAFWSNGDESSLLVAYLDDRGVCTFECVQKSLADP